MNAVAAAGAAFLVAVLWFDLMFDVQVRGHGQDPMPEAVLASIAAYYRRVTTEASPMSRLILVVMLATLAAIIMEIAKGEGPVWSAWLSLGLALSAIGPAIGRTVRNAVRFGGRADPPEAQSRLARAVFRDHIYCCCAMGLVVGFQLFRRR